MLRTRILPAVIGAIVLVAALLPATPAVAAPYVLTGVISLGEEGQLAPAGSVRVTAEGTESGIRHTTLVGADGRFTLNPGLGFWFLTFEHLDGLYADTIPGENYYFDDEMPRTDIAITLARALAISGTVRLGAATAAAGDVSLSLEYRDGEFSPWQAYAGRTSTTDASGRYRLGGLNPLWYRVTAHYLRADQRYVTTTVLAPVQLTADRTLDLSLESASQLTGTAFLGVASTTRAGAGQVEAVLGDGFGNLIGTTTTAADGGYRFGGLAAKRYVLSFRYVGTGPYRTEYQRQQIEVAGSTRRDAAIPELMSISGRVTRDGAAVAGVPVRVERIDGATGRVVQTTSTVSVADGTYAARAQGVGPHRVTFSPTDGSAWESWRDVSPFRTPSLVYLSAGTAVTDIDAELEAGAAVSGRVVGRGIQPADLAFMTVSPWIFDHTAQAWKDTGRTVEVGADGAYAVGGLPDDEYRMVVVYDGPLGTASASSALLSVATGASVTADIWLAFDPPPVTRVTGTDRFGTSAAISARSFDSGVPVVYIANGLNFPDALSAGPAAAEQGGPLLLVMPWDVPAVIEVELRRLDPDRIVVMGGEPSVSLATYAELATFAPTIARIGGGDRFQTSRNLALATFGPGVDSEFGGDVFIVNGLNFPDAVSAGAAAGLIHAPVLLVNGTAASPDLATLTTLRTLGATRVWVLGGANSVSDGVAQGLADTFEFSVYRLTGNDRFGTSEVVTGVFFDEQSEPGEVYLASGLNFPDALAGAAAAATTGSPLLLTRPTCVSDEALFQLYRETVDDVLVLGGTTLLAPSVEALQPCSF